MFFMPNCPNRWGKHHDGVEEQVGGEHGKVGHQQSGIEALGDGFSPLLPERLFAREFGHHKESEYADGYTEEIDRKGHVPGDSPEAAANEGPYGPAYAIAASAPTHHLLLPLSLVGSQDCHGDAGKDAGHEPILSIKRPAARLTTAMVIPWVVIDQTRRAHKAWRRPQVPPIAKEGLLTRQSPPGLSLEHPTGILR